MEKAVQDSSNYIEDVLILKVVSRQVDKTVSAVLNSQGIQTVK